MRYCRRCKGANFADVEVVAKDYGLDTFISYKILNCPCYVAAKTNDTEYSQRTDTAKPGTQMQIL